MPFYQPRGLPHWDPGDAALFLTWRLQGSLPAPPSEWEVRPADQTFLVFDQRLDQVSTGPHWLKVEAIAACVADTLRYGAESLHLYDLAAWVILSNHVHILIEPHAPMARITKTIKNYSAREANRILDRTGQPFWQNESYDRVVRNAKEFAEILKYIEFNPVSAGLADAPEWWRWSSAWARVGQEADHTRRT
jgi:REP element-mobilizing transposase RayT